MSSSPPTTVLVPVETGSVAVLGGSGVATDELALATGSVVLLVAVGLTAALGLGSGATGASAADGALDVGETDGPLTSPAAGLAVPAPPKGSVDAPLETVLVSEDATGVSAAVSVVIVGSDAAPTAGVDESLVPFESINVSPPPSEVALCALHGVP